jgi:hypothetical protein
VSTPPPVRRIFPLPEPPAPPAPPPPPPATRRDRLLVAGLTVMAAAGALGVLSALITLIAYGDDDGSSGLTVASATLGVVGEAVAVGAWVTALLAFRTTGPARARGLVLGAVLVVIYAGIDVLATGLDTAGDAADDLPGSAVGSDLVGLAASTVLLAVGAAAAAAFAGPREPRDARLAWTAVGFAAFAGLQMVATGLQAVSFADLGAEGALLTGIWVTAVAQAFAIGAGTVAGAGLLTPERRDRLLNLALGLYALTQLATATGGFVTAAGMDDLRYAFESLDIAGVRTGSLAVLVAFAGAIVLAEAFRRSADEPAAR